MCRFDAGDSVVDLYSSCGPIFPMYTLFETVSLVPHLGLASFLNKANLHLAFASTLLICIFQVCLLSKAVPRYVAMLCVPARYHPTLYSCVSFG